jgi:hypothetical protein
MCNNYKIIWNKFDGKSIHGLNTKSHGNVILNKEYNDNDIVLLHFGQVDLLFILYHKIKVKKLNINFNDYADNLIFQYKIFIEKLMQKTKNIIISSVTLPSFANDTFMIKKIKKEVGIDDLLNNAYDIQNNTCEYKYEFNLINMTQNTLIFNQKMNILCQSLGIYFLDTTEYFIDNDTKLLKQEYINAKDNHYLYWVRHFNKRNLFVKQKNVYINFFDALEKMLNKILDKK